MRKSLVPLAALTLLVGLGSLASAAVLGPDAGACAAGKSALLVRVIGLKQGSGTLKLALYGSDQSTFLKKEGRLKRIKLPVSSTRPVDVCIAVPGPGRYAVAVHHDLNGNGDKDRHDGGGFSNNPKVSIARLRPAFDRAAVTVGRAPARISVELLYVRGLSVGPAAG